MLQKKRIFIFLAAIVAVSGLTFVSPGQLRLPRPSQKASVMQTIGVTDVTIAYSRPGVKGRTIWGDAPKDSYATGENTLDDSNKRPEGMVIVPYGHVWRTGANEATQFAVTDDVLINGQKLVAGSYSLHTIPGKDEWTIVFNGTANQWGSFSYDQKKDTLRVKAKPQWVADSQEWLAFTIEPSSENSAVVNIRWEKVRVPFTIEVPNVTATTLLHAREAVAAAKADDWRTPFQAAMYARQSKSSDADKWTESALRSIDASLASKETFQALVAKTNLLYAAGRKDEAFATAEKAVIRGKAENADTAAFEKRIADLKAGK
ncbi:MAG: DUF2911 domain-containing protein [Pyrinomonadaceae bacterium]